MISVLLFDDSPYVLKYFEAVLKKHACSVRIFTSQTYEDSINIVRSYDINIAFIDLKMPGKNGADFINFLNSNSKLSDIKKIIVTETGRDTLLKTSLQKEVDAYLHKDEVFADFRKLVNHLDLTQECF